MRRKLPPYEEYLGGLAARERGGRPTEGRLAVAVVYPNRYAVGMSNLGFLSVYREAAGHGGVRVERAFLPEPEHEAALARAGKPILTLESRRPLGRFDLILFSISFENDYLNVLKILSLAQVPVRSADRDDRHPLVGAGGAAAQINPETVSPFIDFFGLGEGEGLTSDILELVGETPARGRVRDEFLGRLSAIPGIYVPSHFEAAYDDRGRLASFRNMRGMPDRLTVRKAADLAGMSLSSPIISDDAEFSGMHLVELERGCPFGCAFCVASGLYGPVRMRPEGDVIADIETGIENADTVGLIGPAVASHPGLVRILTRIADEKKGVGLPSIRAELLTDEGIGALSALSVKTLTIAPEAGTERIRGIIGKRTTDGEIMSLAGRAAAAGIVSVRLYFLVGLPGETDDDIHAIADLAKRVRHTLVSISQGAAKAGRVTVSLTPLVPKPHTPLMWMAMEERKVLEDKIRRVTSLLSGAGGISVVSEPPKWSYIQALLSRGDRRVADILERAAENGDWARALRTSVVNPDFYVLRERDEDELFPWDFIDLGLSKKKLRARYKKIMVEAART